MEILTNLKSSENLLKLDCKIHNIYFNDLMTGILDPTIIQFGIKKYTFYLTKFVKLVIKYYCLSYIYVYNLNYHWFGIEEL